MAKLWPWVVAAFGFLLAGLLLVIGQRDKARAKVKQTQVDLQITQAAREVDTAARKAQEQSRQQSAEVQREDDNRPDDRRPSGTLRR